VERVSQWIPSQEHDNDTHRLLPLTSNGRGPIGILALGIDDCLLLPMTAEVESVWDGRSVEVVVAVVVVVVVVVVVAEGADRLVAAFMDVR